MTTKTGWNEPFENKNLTMRLLFTFLPLCLALLLTAPNTSHAQLTGGVFGPVVTDNHRSMQLRSAHDTNSGAKHVSYGLSLYSAYGTAAEFAARREQQHQLGPYLVFTTSSGFSIQLDTLVSINEGIERTVARLWLGQRL